MNQNEPSIRAGQMDCIFVEICPNDFITCEAGVVIFLDSGFIVKSIPVDNASKTGFFDSAVKYCQRHMSGASEARQSFFNIESGRRKLVLAAPYPCKISSIDLDQYGGAVLCQKESLMFSSKEISQMDVELQINAAEHPCKTSFLMSKISGCGMAYLKTTGDFVERVLETGEILRVNLCSVAAIQSTAEIHAVHQDQCNIDVFSGDAPVMLDLLGPGNIWLHSSPLPGVSNAVHQLAMTVAGQSPVRPLRTDFWNFVHPSFYM